MNSAHPLLDRLRLDSLLAKFPSRRIGLIGDLFLDRYLMIEPRVREVSIETGLEAYQVTQVRNAPGALGTIINNLAALGVEYILPLAVIGEDGHGDDLIRELKLLNGVDLSGLVRCPNRLTPTYTKPMRQEASGSWVELNRLDFRDRQPIAVSAQLELVSKLCENFSDVDGWIVLDQIVEPNWGVVNESLRDQLRGFSASHRDSLIYIDSRRHLADFDFGVAKCNQEELLKVVAQHMTDTAAELSQDTLFKAAVHLARRTGQPALCTLGEKGMLAAQPTGECEMVPGFPVDGPTDIVGAGDAATSAIVATMLSKGTIIEACQMGNLAASITVQKLGETGSASPEELRERHSQVK